MQQTTVNAAAAIIIITHGMLNSQESS